jgi:hypothetical protein
MHSPPARTAAAAIAAVGLALPAAAGANLPHPHTTTIIPGVSVAGVKLDMTKAQALGKWGHGKCDSQLCIWEGKGPAGHREVATIAFYKGKVDSISIRSATKGNNGQFKPGILSDWETKKGIHLGSPKAKVPRAYPAAKANNSTGVNGFDLFKGSRPNLSYTRFGTPGVGASKSLLWGISVSWDVCHRGGPGC